MNAMMKSIPVAAAVVAAPSIAVSAPSNVSSIKPLSVTSLADARLMELGRLFEDAWEKQLVAEAALNARGDNEAPDEERAMDRAYDKVKNIVSLIECSPAQTLAGLRVKARAVLWCHSGEQPIEFGDNQTTNVRLASSLVSDLLRSENTATSTERLPEPDSDAEILALGRKYMVLFSKWIDADERNRTLGAEAHDLAHERSGFDPPHSTGTALAEAFLDELGRTSRANGFDEAHDAWHAIMLEMDPLTRRILSHPSHSTVALELKAFATMHSANFWWGQVRADGDWPECVLRPMIEGMISSDGGRILMGRFITHMAADVESRDDMPEVSELGDREPEGVA